MKKIAQNWLENMKPQTCYWKIDVYIYMWWFILIRTMNYPFWSANFNCFISPCVDYTVVFERRTCVWYFPTAFLYSCFGPFLVILWTRFYFCCSCCWFVACRRIHVNLQNEVYIFFNSCLKVLSPCFNTHMTIRWKKITKRNIFSKSKLTLEKAINIRQSKTNLLSFMSSVYVVTISMQMNIFEHDYISWL